MVNIKSMETDDIDGEKIGCVYAGPSFQVRLLNILFFTFRLKIKLISD